MGGTKAMFSRVSTRGAVSAAPKQDLPKRALLANGQHQRSRPAARRSSPSDNSQGMDFYLSRVECHHPHHASRPPCISPASRKDPQPQQRKQADEDHKITARFQPRPKPLLNVAGDQKGEDGMVRPQAIIRKGIC